MNGIVLSYTNDEAPSAFGVEQRGLAAEILGAGLRAADPARAVARCLKRTDAGLIVANDSGAEVVIPRAAFQRALIVGCGKAAAAMGRAAEDILGDWLTGGMVTVKHGDVVPQTAGKIQLLAADHPVPGPASEAAARAALAVLQQTRRGDLVLALVSGGGSALWALPRPQLTLADKQSVTSLLLDAGAPIGEINTVRRCLSAVKGGQAALAVHPEARLVVLALSDVPGDDPATIASGPFSPNPTSPSDARVVLTKYGLTDRVPFAVRQLLERGSAGQPELNLARFDPRRYTYVICGSNATATAAAADAARSLGFITGVVAEPIIGEARLQAAAFIRRARQAQAAHPRQPCCLIGGGEVTVTIDGPCGTGGRNQEFALAAALELERPASAAAGLLVAALATDGNDGVTEAAGAFADSVTAARARAAGFAPQAALAGHDAAPLFRALGDQIVTGRTGTNVMDLYIALTGAPEKPAQTTATVKAH